MKNIVKIIKETIEEYLHSNVTNVRGTIRPGSREDLHEIVNNEWLIHFTSRPSAESILKDGFLGYENLDFNVSYFDSAKPQGCVAFALKLNREGDDLNVMFKYLDWTHAMVVFQANGFVDRYIHENFKEVIFDTKSVHNMFVITREKKTPSKLDDKGNYRYIYTITLKNGRKINFEDDVFLSSNKIFDWVSNNYHTYRKQLSNNT